MKTTRVVDKDSLLGPFLVGLKGFVGLERFLVSTRLVTVAVGVGPASIYLDGIVYKD